MWLHLDLWELSGSAVCNFWVITLKTKTFDPFATYCLLRNGSGGSRYLGYSNGSFMLRMAIPTSQPGSLNNVGERGLLSFLDSRLRLWEKCTLILFKPVHFWVSVTAAVICALANTPCWPCPCVVKPVAFPKKPSELSSHLRWPLWVRMGTWQQPHFADKETKAQRGLGFVQGHRYRVRTRT